ncbi:MAG: AraC family transcriptional regulator ligand-binding domain-containing protein, partial [Gammaproteobacteria bacterium]
MPTPTPTYTISRDVCDNLLWSAASCGLATGDWSARVDAGVRDGRVAMALFDAIWRDLLAQDPSPTLGLRLGTRFRLGRWGLVEHIVLNSRTTGEAMQCAADYWRLVSDDDKVITLERDAARCRISYLS